MKTQVVFPLCAALALSGAMLVGCNKPAETGDKAGGSASASSNMPAQAPATHVMPETATPASAPATTPETPAPVPAAAPAAAPGPATADAGKGSQSGTLTKADLTGKWLALFGRSEKGLDEAWQRGEVLEFASEGGMVWTHSSGEAPAKYDVTLQGDQLELAPSSKLNVGRDDEVGLMNVGRDDEVGLNKQKPQAKTDKGSGATLRKRIFRDGNYLALIGDQNAIMVYGKVLPQTPDQAPAIKGAYTGNIMDELNQPTTFNWDGKQLTADIDHGHATFSGTYVKGYFVGMAGKSMAALTPRSGGVLDGILLPEPYNMMNATFDFNPGT